MRKGRNFSKIVAFLCSMALVVSGVYVSPNVKATVAKAADDYAVVDLADFLGGETQKSWSGSDQATITAGSGNLDKVTIDGVYNIARYSSVSIGSKTGYRLMLGVNNGSLFYYQFANSKGIVAGGEAKTFDTNALGCNYNGQDVRIKTTFEFANLDETTGLADLTIKIQIGDYLAEQELNFTGVTMAEMTKTIFVNANTGAVTLKAAPDDTPIVLGIDDFVGGAAQKSWTGTNSELITAGEGTLDNVTVEGVFNIARYSSIAIGSQAGCRLMIGVNNSSVFYYQFVNAKGIMAGGEAKTFDANALGCNYNGQDVPIKVSFEFARQNYITGTADVTIKMQIGDYLEEQVLNISGVVMSQMGRSIFANPNTGAITLKTMPEETHTVLGIDDFIGGAAQKSWTGTNSELLKAGDGTLDNVTIEGVFNLARYSSIAIGSQTGCRLMMGVNNGSMFYYQFANAGGIMAGGETKTFDANALGCNYNGQDVPIKVVFEFSKQNYITGTASVTIKMQIGDYLAEQVLNISGVAMSQMGRNIFVNPNTGAITLKTTPEETQTVLGIDDFIGGATQKSWTGTNSELLTAGTGTLDNVTVEGVFNIARYSNVAIGSQTGARLMIGVNNSSIFYYQFADSRGIVAGGEAKTFDQNALGCYYNGQDVPIKVSFEFSKQNYITGTADVTIKLQIGEYLDEQKMNLSNINMSQLGRNIFVNPSTGAITLKAIPEETLTVLGIKDFVGEDNQTNTDTDAKLYTAGDGNLDRVMIDGTINLSRYASIMIGSQAKNRLQIGIGNDYVLYYQYADASGIVNNIRETFDNSYAGKDVRINVTFVYSKRNYITGIADVTVRLVIGDSIERDFTVSGIRMAELARVIFMNPNTGSITMKENEEYYTPGTGFTFSGEGLTVNGESVSQVNLTQVGDYYVECTQGTPFAKYVVIYILGDAHADGEMKANDLMAVLRAKAGKALYTKAGTKAADTDGNGIVNDDDYESICTMLLQ